jgi:hypothetical protein
VCVCVFYLVVQLWLSIGRGVFRPRGLAQSGGGRRRRYRRPRDHARRRRRRRRRHRGQGHRHRRYCRSSSSRRRRHGRRRRRRRPGTRGWRATRARGHALHRLAPRRGEAHAVSLAAGGRRLAATLLLFSGQREKTCFSPAPRDDDSLASLRDAGLRGWPSLAPTLGASLAMRSSAFPGLPRVDFLAKGTFRKIRSGCPYVAKSKSRAP